MPDLGQGPEMSNPATATAVNPVPRVKVSVTTIDGELLGWTVVMPFNPKGKPMHPPTAEILANEIISTIEDNFNTEN